MPLSIYFQEKLSLIKSQETTVPNLQNRLLKLQLNHVIQIKVLYFTTITTFSDYLAENGITQSFSKVRNPYDNSVAESFFSSLKREELYRRKIKSEYELKKIICDYIEFYNNHRPHTTINYKTPNQYECEYFGNNEENTD